MKNLFKQFLTAFCAVLLLPSLTATQSGEQFDTTKSVVASGGVFTLEQTAIVNGGGAIVDNTNNIFKIEGTIGQPAVRTNIANPPYRLDGGFWTFAPLAPTAASVSVGGRILTSDGQGIRNVQVILTEKDGTVRTVVTGSFGYYRFDKISVGQIVIVSVFSKRFRFSTPIQVVNVSDMVESLNFTADIQ